MDKWTKLPKWVQMELQTLQANVEYWKDKATEAAAENPDDTDTFLSGGCRSDDKGLPKGSSIKFTLNKKFETRVDVCVRGDTLKIMGDDSIIILPTAANCIDIKFRDR